MKALDQLVRGRERDAQAVSDKPDIHERAIEEEIQNSEGIRREAVFLNQSASINAPPATSDRWITSGAAIATAIGKE